MWLILPEDIKLGELLWDQARYTEHEDVAYVHAKCVAVESLADDEVKDVLGQLGDIESHTWLIAYNDFVWVRGHGTQVHVRQLTPLPSGEPEEVSE